MIGQIANPHTKNLTQAGKGTVFQKDQIMMDMAEKVKTLAEVYKLQVQKKGTQNPTLHREKPNHWPPKSISLYRLALSSKRKIFSRIS